MQNPYIRLENICKKYGKTPVIERLNLTINKGERLVLLGPSGCGKSTTLRMIAGLENISDGQLFIDHKKMNDVPAGKRGISMVFQDYALYPHMTVERNISYALKVNKMDREEILRRQKKVISILNLEGFEKRYPRDLSGGQRQRVALARSIAKQSSIFLLDEPLSNLDAQMRISARRELLKIHQLYHQTFIYVTHDQIEAMTLGERIALMKDGALQMLDTPYNTYHHPSNVFVAKFIGTPSTNMLETRFEDGFLHFKDVSMKLIEPWIRLIQQSRITDLYLGIRPEYIKLAETSDALMGVVIRTEEYGNQLGVIFQFDGIEMTAISEDRDWKENMKIYFSIDQEKMFLFDHASTQTIGYPDEFSRSEETIELER